MQGNNSGQTLLFDTRFLERHAGPIITDASVAIVELVANAWDAFATEVHIVWPDPSKSVAFSIRDDGKGMNRAQFKERWATIDYDKVSIEGSKAFPPSELRELPPRQSYGRNGRGRHAAFRFSDPYLVITACDGVEVTFEVERGLKQPFEWRELATRELDVGMHGTEIRAISATNLALSADSAREIIGTRFLADPNFQVFVNGVKITFDDIPDHSMNRMPVEIPGYGVVEIVIIDSLRSDKTTKQHGIAWRVNSRLVGSPSWAGFDH